jgi:hypothetical protein
MSNFLQRNYYKIFTGTNQNDGSDKIRLGYESSTSEIILKKDKTTYFHIPFFSAPQKLIDSTLVADGATAGPIPALSDRIFKKEGGYEKNTPWGNTSGIRDGNWLCSWLYAVPNSSPQWYDRYYNPGYIEIEDALEQEISLENYLNLPYIKNDIPYIDIPSQMLLEPSVWYQYFHHGEKSSSDIVQTYSGNEKEKIRLDITDWSAEFLDQSIYKNKVTIKNFTQSWVKNINQTDYIDKNVLDFDNNNFIDCRVNYNQTYNLLNEFSICFWFSNKNWSNATSTQLIGNLNKSGFSVFYNNLNTQPYFVLPETTYGHLFLFNQKGDLYTVKNLQRSLELLIKPVFIGINSEYETILVDELSQKVYKHNHLGNLITQSLSSSGGFFTLEGTPKIGILDGYDNLFVATTSGTYIFDQNLILTEYLSAAPYHDNEIFAFDINGSLVREPSSIDIKFDNFNNKWTIKTDKKIYCNDQLINYPGVIATNLAIDPENNIWVLADINDVYKFNPITKQVITNFKIGQSTEIPDTKLISFIYEHNRANNTKTWYALIIFNNERNLYQLTLNGAIKSVTDLTIRFNTTNPLSRDQDPRKITFKCPGDFTGYEKKRIFNKIIFNNKHQLQFKVGLKTPIENKPFLKYNLSVPVDGLVNDSWYFVTCTFKNSEMNLYINGKLYESLRIPRNFDLSYIFKNELFIGTSTGEADNFNKEINNDVLIWNGYLDTVKIYDYALGQNKMEPFIREKIVAQDIVWNVSSTPTQNIETIERLFKHRVPGHKSSFFNIKLTGLKIKDLKIRAQIEKDIRTVIEQIAPVNAKLYTVEWID